jgi:hypothetical protein
VKVVTAKYLEEKATRNVLGYLKDKFERIFLKLRKSYAYLSGIKALNVILPFRLPNAPSD